MFGLNVIEMTFLAGFGVGFSLAGLLGLLLYVRPMTKAFQRLRYDGFRPEMPVEPRPKTVPHPPFPNEAL